MELAEAYVLVCWLLPYAYKVASFLESKSTLGSAAEGGHEGNCDRPAPPVTWEEDYATSYSNRATPSGPWSSDLSALPPPSAFFVLIYGDVTDYHSLLSAFSGCDVVFHAAALVEPCLPRPSYLFSGLPLSLCNQYLPKRDATVVLVDEDGEEYNTVYLVNKHRLSGGWRGFATAHELVDGDALVFQLTRPTTFKVYIIRVEES